MRLNVFPFFFFNDTATTEIYTLSLHDALPISHDIQRTTNGARVFHHEGDALTLDRLVFLVHHPVLPCHTQDRVVDERSEEHTSELQSRQYLVCRLLLEKKKTNTKCKR